MTDPPSKSASLSINPGSNKWKGQVTFRLAEVAITRTLFADGTGVCGVGRRTSSMREMAVEQGLERRDQPDEEGNRFAGKRTIIGLGNKSE